MSELPAASVSIDCGACYTTLEHDGDNYRCFPCGLTYDTDPFSGEPAEFSDEGAKPCDEPPTVKPWTDRKPFETANGVVKTWRNWTFAYSSCLLPEGHEAEHHRPLDATFTQDEGEPNERP